MLTRIIEVDPGGSDPAAAKSYFELEARCGQTTCGWIKVMRALTRTHGRTAWVVRNVIVDERYRRRRIGTQLYEAAAHEACRRRGQLVSKAGMRTPGAYSHDFWAKQARMGYARVLRNGTYVLPCPVTTLARPQR